MKLISIITPCYNEEGNVKELAAAVKAVFARLGKYRYEHIFIDNASTDNTAAVLKQLAAGDPNVKVIVNARNFGHIRSPFHAVCQARGDAVVTLAGDLQDPPEMIVDMVREWENGYSMVLGVKRSSEENSLMFWVRKRYYRLVNRLSSVEIEAHCEESVLAQIDQVAARYIVRGIPSVHDDPCLVAVDR